MKYIETFPGVVVAPVDSRTANHLLKTSLPGEKSFIAGLYRFIELTDDAAAAMVGRHVKFGWFRYPIIQKDDAMKNNSWNMNENISVQQAFTQTSRDSLFSALYLVNKDFNPNTDYVYIKLDF